MDASGWIPPPGGSASGLTGQAVRAELAAHLEDKQVDLRRIFPDMSPEEAEHRALESMGNPEEIGRELAKLHRPWLGYLWWASKWVAVVLTVVFLVVSVLKYEDYQLTGYPLLGSSGAVYGRTAGEKVQVKGYTFQIVGAAFLDYPEDSPYIDSIQVAFRVSTPRFWERLNQAALQDALTLTAADGQQWKMNRGEVNMEKPENGDKIEGQYCWQLVCGLERVAWTPFSDTYVASGNPEWREGDWARLDFDFVAHSFP